MCRLHRDSEVNGLSIWLLLLEHDDFSTRFLDLCQTFSTCFNYHVLEMVNRLVSSQSRNLGLTHNHSLRAPSTVRSTEKSVKADLHPHVCKILYRPEITHAIKSSRPIFQHSAKKHSDWYFFDLRAAHAEDVECQFIRYDFCFKGRPAKNAAITRDVMKAENFPNRKSSAQIPSPEPTNLPKPHKTQWNR